MYISLARSSSLVFIPNELNALQCSCTGVCQMRPEIWLEPDLAGFGKNGRISDLPELEPKSGATLVKMLSRVMYLCTLLCNWTRWNDTISFHYCTRKLCYRKDDRAMRPRPTYGCPSWQFSGLPDYAHGHYSQRYHGLLFRSTLSMFLQDLKSVAVPVPEIIRGTQKIWAVPGNPHAPFSPKF